MAVFQRERAPESAWETIGWFGNRLTASLVLLPDYTVGMLQIRVLLDLKTEGGTVCQSLVQAFG